ncbi:MAG: tetratricopeptide repeat protein [Saprospiraceae bacterium]|nr:tetratricopeptide repeat protein [Saprospiraceae bacterium]
MKYLIPHFIQEKFEDHQTYGTFEGYTLFLDLSGFTPLTETLMDKGNSGAEELSIILNDIFEPLVHIVYQRGGFIPYFAGDAFTAIFPVEATQPSGVDSALACCLDAALTARDYFKHRSYKFGTFTIGLKIGLSFGSIEWGIVGRHQRAYYFRGAPIDASAVCQGLARHQDFPLVLDQHFYNRGLPEAISLIHLSEGYFGITPSSVLPNQSKPTILPAPNEEVTRQFLPDAIVNYQQEGEFRSVISVFMSFDGINDPRLLNRFIGDILEQIYNFSGYFKEIDFGDKGGVIAAFFGAPVSFENNIERALEFVYVLHQDLADLRRRYNFHYRIGITQGTAYTGIVGGLERCQYAAVGNRVNLAARLMMYADWGEVLVDSEISKTRHFQFQHRGDIKYKGIDGNIPTFRLTGKNDSYYSAYEGTMVGRETELQSMLDFAQPIFRGKSTGIIQVFGEAGIGKSRLTHELRNKLKSSGHVQWLVCQSDQILRKPFNPFIFFLRNYFLQSPDRSNQENLEQFEKKFQSLLDASVSHTNLQWEELKAELIRTKSVLAALLGIVYFDSLWEQLDAKGRYRNTIQAVVNLILSESLIKPVVLELEDAHWLDENSRELLQDFVRFLPRYPILLLVTSRYKDDGSKPTFFDLNLLTELHLPVISLDLNFLESSAARSFAEYRLGGPTSDSFFAMLLRTTNANPFYLQQLLEYFGEQDLLIQKNGQWMLADDNVQLSSSINAILTARIDRLSTPVKETVKTAAVIGREFETPILAEVMRLNPEFGNAYTFSNANLMDQIQIAEDGQIWQAMSDHRYIFKHSLLREAAYGMQLRTRLQLAHRHIAEAIERIYKSNIKSWYVDLAFHYNQAGILDKTCHFLEKAANHARDNFQNQQALELYEKLLEKLHDESDIAHQIRTLLKKGRILELIGEWDACETTYRKALQLASSFKDALLLGNANNSLGQVLILKGEYSEALEALQKAEHLFESENNQSGKVSVKGNLGNLHFRQGAYNDAQTYFQDSIAIGRTLLPPMVDAHIVANLGLTFMNRGEFTEGIRYQQEQLTICQKNNDQQGAATIFTYMGIVHLEHGSHLAALESFQKGLAISEELGNKHLVSIAIGNIGIVYERQGDYIRAMDHYVDDLELCEQLGDKQGTAIALGLIGQLLNIQGDSYKAIAYLQKSLMISEDLNYRKGIAKAVNTLGDIFYYLQQYDRSLHFYNRAIEMTRTIGNKLVLGNSLVEKGTVLLEVGDRSALKHVMEEALSIAEVLGNPDLLFDARLLQAQTARLMNDKTKAKTILIDLLTNPIDKDHEVAARYEWLQLFPDDKNQKEKAITLYKDLYKETPRFIYQKRLENLQNQS